MADWTIGTGSVMTHGRSRGGASTPVIQYFQESTCPSTQVIKYGDVVSRDTTVSTGGLRIRRGYSSGGDGANLLLIGQTIVGIAAEGSTSDGSTTGNVDPVAGAIVKKKLGVFVAEPDTEFVGYLSAGASASSNNGDNFAVRFDSTNQVWMVDSTNSTAALVTVKQTGVVDGTEGDTNGPIYFKFLSSNVYLGVI
jgi:hypothetical protein